MASRVTCMSVLVLLLNSTATAYTETPSAAQAVADAATDDWAAGGWWILPLGLVICLVFWAQL